MLRCLLPAASLLALVVARPAASVLIDDEPSNDAMGTATVQIVPTAAVTKDTGEFTLFGQQFTPPVPGDVDYLGIGNLNIDDIVTVSTTPLGDVSLNIPDTFIGLFAPGRSKECENDDTINNLLPFPPTGRGSLCRFVIDSAGTWYVGVSGPSDPPFTGEHSQNGVYQLNVTINAVSPPPSPTPAPTAPAGAVLTDDEPCNDAIAASGPCPFGAPIQMVKTGPVTIDGGEFVLVAGDIDFVGIAALATGDIVTLTTTPLELVVSRDLDVPDTIAGVFDSNTADPTADILCMGDNTANNDLDTGCGAGLCPGLGSLCRFEIPAPGDYYVGVTGFRPTSPGGCTPGVDCTTAPFDGGITPGSPCEESNGATITCGNYQVTIAVHSLPEPGVILQLASGLLSLLVLDKRRRRANR